MEKQQGAFERWNRRYLIEYFGALALCIVASGICIILMRAGTSQSARFFLLALPAAAILVMAIVVLRHFQRVDEFIRRLMLDCFAVTGAFALICALAYGIFEIAGLPRISMWWLFGGTVLVWNLCMARAIRR
jgi:hypothetical protein